MEFLNEIWTWIASIVGGVSLAGIVTTVIYGALKGAFNRTISKINVQKIADEATEKGVERVKKVSFTHSIQPIVESELKKINEKASEALKAELKEVNENYARLVVCIEKLAAYFDYSIGVTDTAKAELKEAIAEAKKPESAVESVVVEEEVQELPFPEVAVDYPAKVEPTLNAYKVER